MGNDLGFLLIFIILPTVLIVSGFWLIVLVRRDARLSSPPQVNTIDEEVETQEADAVETPLAKDAVPDVAAPLPVKQSAPGAAPLTPEHAPFVTDLDDGSPGDVEDEFWTDDVPGEQGPDTADDVPDAGEESETVPQSGLTTEIEPVQQSSNPGESTGTTPHEDPGTEEAAELDVEASSQSGNTCNLPDHREVGTDAEDGDKNDANESSRRRRQPGARLVPSTEHVQRRTGATNRRAPQIPKSATRDEDDVEGTDSG